MRNLCNTTPVFLTILSVAQTLSCPTCPRPEDAKLNFTQLAKKYGHSAEEFDIVTEDGYILTVFHIPGKKKGSILLMHGILCSADAFIIRGNTSLAITLADQNHDVWVGNTRGNKYARRHKTLDPDSNPDFWNFSFHEAGYYDLAATIDYVLNSTDEKSIRTIGHSQGTTIHFVLFSTRPEYNDKVKGFIALAPVAFLSNLEPPVSTATVVWPLLDEFMQSLGIEEIFRDHSVTSELFELICSQGIISYDICYFLFVAPFSGYDPKRIEPDFWEIVTGHFPAGTSRKSVRHFVQVALNKRFAYFDDDEFLGVLSDESPRHLNFESRGSLNKDSSEILKFNTMGNLENIERNLSDESSASGLRREELSVPPRYNLGNITTNITLIVSKNDALSKMKDVDILRSMLLEEPSYHLMEPPQWSHLDFIWANDMDVYLYPYVFSRLQEYE